jgi:type IV secretion system protein VirB5
MAPSSIIRTDPKSPYLAASGALRSEYERLERVNQILRHGMIAMALALVITSALVLFLARKPRIVPYVIELDKVGEVTGLLQPLVADQSANESVIRFELARFITDARSVLGDGAAEKAALHRVYNMARGEAASVLPIWYRNHPPFEVAGKETIQADVESVLHAPNGGYEVRWTETTRNLNGDVLSIAHWRGLLAVQVATPDPDHILSNPLGLYVTQIDWSEEQGS